MRDLHSCAGILRSPTLTRLLTEIPDPPARHRQLALVVLITVALYFALYIGGGVAPLIMGEKAVDFGYLVATLAIANAAGAFASLAAGAADRTGRARVVLWGLALVTVLTFAMPLAPPGRLAWAAITVAVAVVEGVILVVTPALTRDFSPQVGRATAMGFWTVGPVLGSLLTSLTVSTTLPVFGTWRSQFLICGVFCTAVWLLAAAFLRELAPAVRDRIFRSEGDRARLAVGTTEIRASPPPRLSSAFAASLVASALGVSLLLLIYYTTVAFGVIYLATVYGLSPARANAVLNWCWGANAVALVLAGVWSDQLRVRKPFMLVCGLLAVVLILLLPGRSTGHPPVAALAASGAAISVVMGGAYATWMAAYTEMLEEQDPALVAPGLAIWGWLLRLVVTASFVALPFLVRSVTPLLVARPVIGAYEAAQEAGAVPPALALAVRRIAQAAVDAPGEWRAWHVICALGALAFVASVFVMPGAWRPRDAHTARHTPSA